MEWAASLYRHPTLSRGRSLALSLRVSHPLTHLPHTPTHTHTHTHTMAETNTDLVRGLSMLLSLRKHTAAALVRHELSVAVDVRVPMLRAGLERSGELRGRTT